MFQVAGDDGKYRYSVESDDDNGIDEPKPLRFAFQFQHAKVKDDFVAALNAQASIYLNRADDARIGLFDLQSATLGGAVVGAIGGIVGNVATIATGVGIAAGSNVLAQQYSLTAQSEIYNTAAGRTTCVATILESSTAGTESPLIIAARTASTKILMDVRRGLATLKAPEISPATVMALYTSKFGQAFVVKNGVILSAQNQDLTTSAKLDIASCAETGVPISTSIQGPPIVFGDVE
ncbi:hypothetical protein H0A71_22625 [Alcaligenaceae bacterium]|nr:hypothetical protein [Alcaligenaceae bacterium]